MNLREIATGAVLRLVKAADAMSGPPGSKQPASKPLTGVSNPNQAKQTGVGLAAGDLAQSKALAQAQFNASPQGITARQNRLGARPGPAPTAGQYLNQYGYNPRLAGQMSGGGPDYDMAVQQRMTDASRSRATAQSAAQPTVAKPALPAHNPVDLQFTPEEANLYASRQTPEGRRAVEMAAYRRQHGPVTQPGQFRALNGPLYNKPSPGIAQKSPAPAPAAQPPAAPQPAAPLTGPTLNPATGAPPATEPRYKWQPPGAYAQQSAGPTLNAADGTALSAASPAAPVATSPAGGWLNSAKATLNSLPLAAKAQPAANAIGQLGNNAIGQAASFGQSAANRVAAWTKALFNPAQTPAARAGTIGSMVQPDPRLAAQSLRPDLRPTPEMLQMMNNITPEQITALGSGG